MAGDGVNVSELDLEVFQGDLESSVTLLEGVAANPELRLSQLPVLTRSEQRLMLEEWNDTTTTVPAGGLSAEDFPALPEGKAKGGIEIPGEVLRDLIARNLELLRRAGMRTEGDQ